MKQRGHQGDIRYPPAVLVLRGGEGLNNLVVGESAMVSVKGVVGLDSGRTQWQQLK